MKPLLVVAPGALGVVVEVCGRRKKGLVSCVCWRGWSLSIHLAVAVCKCCSFLFVFGGTVVV